MSRCVTIIRTGSFFLVQVQNYPFRACSIFAQVSRSDTVRLKTSLSGRESESTRNTLALELEAVARRGSAQARFENAG